MIETPNIWNTGLPLLIMGALGWLLPRMLVPEGTRSHQRVALGVVLSIVGLIAASALVLVAFDSAAYRGVMDVGGVMLATEIALRNSALFAVAWAPIVALSWFNMAQWFEVQRGKDLAREDGA